MAWSDPPDWTSSVLTSSQMDQYVSANLSYLKGVADGVTFSGVQLTRSASTSIADNTATAITWTAEAFDFGGWWSSGTNIVVPSGAIPSGFTTVAILVIARTVWSSNGSGYRRIRTLKNGTSFGFTNTSAISSDTTDISIVEFTTVVAGDILTVDVTQTSGGSLSCSNTQVSLVRFAPAS